MIQDTSRELPHDGQRTAAPLWRLHPELAAGLLVIGGVTGEAIAPAMGR